MTVIVYRDGIIASDSQVIGRNYTCMGGFAKVAHRVYKDEVYLYGAAGETAYAAKFDRWMQSEAFDTFIDTGEGHPNLEPGARDEQCTGLLFTPQGTCIRFEGNYPPYELTGEYFAIGSGDQVALGALYAGADAATAVRAAIEHDVLSNGRVQTIDRKMISTTNLENFKAMPA